MISEKLKQLAIDLRQPPPSTHDQLGGLVVVDLVKYRAALLGINGEYNYQSCVHAHFLWESTRSRPTHSTNS